tara:strand:- start:6 stop:869 length:864 start_codon:yes stop_codon:yes gene_type:complete
MLDNFVLKKITNYLDLIRFDKPIGFLLLMWPSWFALSLLKSKNTSIFFWYFIFFIGSFLMRSAGCIINDIVDRKIDIKIKRTEERPLASNKISITESLIFLSILLLLSFLILIQFNYISIIVALSIMPLVILYPYMKRITHWPQLILGLVFSWGIIIVSLEFNQVITLNYGLLYIGCIFWTMGYDTIYAYQDLNDDLKNNIKSTAVFFNKKGKLFVSICYILMFIIFGYIGWKSSNSLVSLIVIATIAICTYIAIQKWDINSSKSSNFYFRQNNILAFMLFLYLLIF